MSERLRWFLPHHPDVLGLLRSQADVAIRGVAAFARWSVAVVFGLGTIVGGGRVVRRVSRGYFRPMPVDSLASQASAAAVIFGSTAVGAPVSTSTVVTAAVVGVGADRHPRHVRWAGVADTISAWFLTIPVCAILGALLYLCASLRT